MRPVGSWHMCSLSRKTILVVLGLLALGVIAYQVSSFLHLASFSGSKLLFAVRNADAYYIILALVAIYSCYGIRSLRWQVFQRNIGDTNFWQIYKLTLAGFAALFLLGRAGAAGGAVPLAPPFLCWAGRASRSGPCCWQKKRAYRLQTPSAFTFSSVFSIWLALLSSPPEARSYFAFARPP